MLGIARYGMTKFLEDMESRYPELTESQKKVAQFIIHHYEQVVFYTLDELSAEIGVSTTTVIRFARSLGYTGYSDLLAHIQQIVKMKMNLPERLDQFNTNIAPDSLLNLSFQHDIDNITLTRNSLDPNKLALFSKELIDAKTIYILGLRSSFSIAFYCAAVLGQIRENVRLIRSEGDLAPEEVLSAKSGEICLVFSFSRYTQRTIDIASWMHKQGVKILAVSDQALSPIANVSDLTLTCEVKGLTFKNSLVAPFCLVNYFVAAVVSSDKNRAKHVLSRNDDLLRSGKYFAI